MHFGAVIAAKSDNFENAARPTNFGALCTPTLTDGGKRFMALTNTSDRLTNLKESPF